MEQIATNGGISDIFPALPKVFRFLTKTNAIFLSFFQRKRFTFCDLSDKILLVY